MWSGAGATRWPRRQRADRRVTGDRLLSHLRALAEFGKTPEGGISRVAYGDADRAAREWVAGLMHAAGLETTIDAAANLIGRRAGSGRRLPPLMLGSHIDSVPQGGNYDGQVGSMAAIEVAHTLAERARDTRHPLEVVIFANEEGGKTGSRAMSGEVAPSELALVTASGRTIGDGTAFLGGDPAKLDTVRRRRGDVAAYLELHVEQGAVLERQGVPIGVVEGIVGIKRWSVTVTGFANHAGTTPMDDRQDALLAAARLVDAVHRIVKSEPGRQVGTVGRLRVEPDAPNVIPGRAVLSLELRDLDMGKIDRVFEQIRRAASEIAEDTRTQVQLEQFYVSPSALTDERIRQVIAGAAGDLGLRAVRLPSGAGHDAQSVAQFAPIGMIFVPSVGGISHSPQELSRPEDIVAGANVLLRSVLALDDRAE